MNHRFLHIINSTKPVLVDFYTDWCGPCKKMPSILKQVKEEIKGLRIVKVNVDKNPAIASYFKVQRIPTLIMFKDGKPLWTGEGVFSADELKEILREQIGAH
ncbi:thioredoxin [Mariniphaga sediminis]|jgi:thioredoxin 1|uniref:Thioredoxin n=1 Tax=Mariniphaga sediminis TaxID=1628158 RepID=A0A399CYW6_9BACT|nr:thioredoxin family protein [Mariniphaga sediminis]RIH64854.1 thioredoxin [Mariniphaga sediminis]